MAIFENKETRKLKKTKEELLLKTYQQEIVALKQRELMPKLNMHSIIEDYISDCEADTINKYEIEGANDAFNQTLDDMKFKYFWDKGIKDSVKDGYSAFFVYYSSFANRPVIKLIDGLNINFRANILVGVSFNFKQSIKKWDNETADIKIILDKNKKIDLDVKSHKLNESLDTKEEDLQDVKDEILKVKDLNYIPIFLFPNNRDWNPTLQDEKIKTLVEQYRHTFEKIEDELDYAGTKFIINQNGSQIDRATKRKDEAKAGYIVNSKAHGDNSDYMDYSPNQVEKPIQAKKSIFDDIARFAFINTSAETKGAQQTQSEVNNHNSQIHNHYENKLELWNVEFNKMVKCIATMSNNSITKANLQLATQAQLQLDTSQTQTTNLNRTEDDNASS